MPGLACFTFSIFSTPVPGTSSLVTSAFVPDMAHAQPARGTARVTGTVRGDNGQPVAQGGTLEVDTMFTPDVAGDSAFIFPGQKSFSFKVTAKKGSRLYFFCAIHPWMQGKLTVN